MNFWKRIAAAFFAICITLPFTACSGDTSWVYDYEDIQITSGMYIAFTMNAYSQVSEQDDYDSTKDILDQTIEDKSATDWIRERASEMANEYVATLRKFEELGLTLDESDEQDIDNTVESYWESYGDIYESNGVGEASYRKLIEAQIKRYKIFLKYYGEGGLEEVPVSELEAHFKENFASVNIISISLTTGDDLTDEQKQENETRTEMANEYANLLNSGENTFPEVYDMWQHYLLGTEHSDDETLQDEMDMATYMQKDSTTPSEKIVNSIFSDVEIEGDAKVLSSDSALYVVKRYDVMKDEKNLEDMRETVLSDIKSDDFLTMLEEWSKDLTRTTNDSAYNRYNPKNIKVG